MLGDSLLVAPVFHKSQVKLYLPAGTWTCLWSEEQIIGPKWVEKDVPLTIIPVYVRENTVLLLGPEDVSVPDYEYSKTALEVRSYALTSDVQVDVPVGPGKWEMAGKFTVKKDGSFEKGQFDFVRRQEGKADPERLVV